MKKEYNRLYDKITPLVTDDELLHEVIRKADSMNKNKAIRFKKPAAVLCAGIAAVSLGVTVAAATGIINFNELFGSHIISDDENLANSLLSKPENISWEVSDDNYEIKMNGAAGTKNCIIASFELVRKDGKPVKDFMINLPDEGEKLKTIGNEGHIDGAFNSFGSQLDITLNDEGNLDFYSYITCDGDLSGTAVTYNGVNFYPEMLLVDFETKNNVFPNYIDDVGAGFYSFVSSPSLTDLSVDSEDILGLELDWSLKFTYEPNELASVEKKIVEENSEIEMTMNVVRVVDDDYKELPTVFDMEIIDSCFTQVNGRIVTQCINTAHENTFMDANGSEAAVIMNDGTEIPAVLHSLFGTVHEDNICETSFEIKYSPDVWSNPTIIDINNVKAVRILDKTFELE